MRDDYRSRVTTSSETARALAAKWNKELGPGAIVIASDQVIPRKYTSGSLSLDISLNGGFSGNQWVEVYGPENHGKTVITLKTLAANQAENHDHRTLWVAAEPYDEDQARALGVDSSKVELLTTRDMAVAYDVTLDYLTERAVDMVVIDSYPALIPPQEDEKEMDGYTQAEGAKMTNKFFRKVGKAGLRDPLDPLDRPWLGIFINQPREKISKGWNPTGAPQETTPGGRGKNFAFYTRLQVKRAEWLYLGAADKGNRVGQVIRTQAIKHKGGPPMRVGSMDFYFTDVPELNFKRGEYDVPKDVLTGAVIYGVVKKGGLVHLRGPQDSGPPGGAPSHPGGARLPQGCRGGHPRGSRQPARQAHVERGRSRVGQHRPDQDPPTQEEGR